MSASPLTNDKRAIHRVPCRLAVSSADRSANIGTAVDISLDGLFILTEKPLPKGTLLPLVLPLPGGEITARAEVVRVVDGQGMGLRLLELADRDARRLRRFVGELNSVDGSRRTARRLLDVAGRTIEPIREPGRIQALLEQARVRSVDITLIPGDRHVRQIAKVRQVDDALRLVSRETPLLQPGDRALVLTTVDFVSYTFEVDVLEAEGERLVLPLPKLVAYSERRSDVRDQTGARHLELPRQWGAANWPVLETSQGGLSILVEAEHCHFTRGQPLTGARLISDQGSSVLIEATVRHLTPLADGIKVGIQHGLREESPTTEHLSTTEEASGLQRLGRWFTSKVGQVGALVRNKTRQTQPFTVVNLPSRNGLMMRGLLNLAYPGETARAPLVIILPGYGGRKEQLSGLAYTLTENFRRHHRDVAVLRVDGTNNLGESETAPGNDTEGRKTMGYTVSGAVDDLMGCLEWARTNTFVQPTTVVVVSSSFSSIAVSRALATQDCSEVSHWVAFMGAADAQDAILHVSGGQDVIGNWHRGIRPVGIITLVGCMTDGDAFCSDLEVNHGGGTLRQARADMAHIACDVTWVVGEQDAFMDPRRVDHLMAVKSDGAARRVLRAPCPHVPRSSEEACELFLAVTRDIWRNLYGSSLDSPIIPRSVIGEAWLAEWARVRSGPVDRENWWRDYLLGDDDGPGFDVLTWSPHYTGFVDQQVQLLEPTGRVLDVGAGTGNISWRLLQDDVSVVSVDLVPEALERVRDKASGADLETLVHDVDGNPRTAMSRFRAGELTGMEELLRRTPGVPGTLAVRLQKVWSPELLAVLRGAEMDVARVAEGAGLSKAEQAVLVDLNTLARVSAGRLSADQARLTRLSDKTLRCRPGLPFPDASFDRVIASLLLSYLDHPQDTLSDLFRVMKPGGLLVVSTMKPDADSSRLFTELVHDLTVAEDHTRLELARRFMDHASALLRLEEEGVWTFFSAEELAQRVRAAGFEDIVVERGFGDPPQAILVRGRRP